MVTLQSFYLGKVDLLTFYLGKLNFLSVTDFSPGNLPRGNFIVWSWELTEPDIAHVVKEILGARVSSTKVILAQIRDVAVPSKIVSIF